MSGEGRENIFEIEAEKKLKELARAYWFKLNLSRLGKDLGAEIEAAQEAYTRYLDGLENSLMLPREKVTEIIREAREEAHQDAETQIKEENKLKISQLN